MATIENNKRMKSSFATTVLDKRYVAEFVGTFLLVFFAVGGAALGGIHPGFTFTVAFLIAFFLIGPISGCHINPAVSVAMLVNKKMEKRDFVGYLVAQFLGALLAAFIIFIFVMSLGGSAGVGSMGANQYEDMLVISATSSPARGVQILMAFLFETLVTFIFVLVIIFAIAKCENNVTKGVVIALTLGAIHFVGGTVLTGVSVNPARSFGPGLFAGGEGLRQVWLFLIAPFVGAVLAAYTSRLLLEGDEEVDVYDDAEVEVAQVVAGQSTPTRSEESIAPQQAPAAEPHIAQNNYQPKSSMLFED